MISASNLRFADEIEPEPPSLEGRPEDDVGPQVFVRTVTSPPGWPWEQRRAVDLEARYGAPLPIAELAYRVRRLEAWRPAAASRFAVFYVLAREVKGQLEASAEVDGQRLSVTFGAGAQAGAFAGRALLRALVIGGVGLVVAWTLVSAFERRAQTTAALQFAEQRAATKLRKAQALDHIRDQGRLLDLQLDRGARLSDVVADLAWASNAKAPGARVEAVHWDHGLLAFEVRGEATPFGVVSDRQVQRAKGAVRTGVWLWGVTKGPPVGAVGGATQGRRP